MAALDTAMLTLAHEGGAVFRDRYELVRRHRAERPNATWQADHTQLDIPTFSSWTRTGKKRGRG